MAKGDRSRVQNAIDYGASNSQNNLNNAMTRQDQRYGNFYNNYQTGANRNLADYNSVMQNYDLFRNPGSTNMMPGDTSSFGDLTNAQNWMNLVGNPQQLAQWVKASYPGLSDEGVNYYVKHIQEKPGANPNEQAGSASYWQGRMPEWLQQHSGDPFYDAISKSLGGYGNFAETGGFSPQDIQNIRARMIAPIRSVYSSANRAVDTQRRLQHGYSPNYTAAKAKMAREQAYATSDATTNAEADIAQMLQQGKLAGLGGLAQTGGAARGQNLQSLAGQTSLYGANPGLTQTFGNQLLTSAGQDLDIQKLQQAINEFKVQAQLAQSGLPSNFRQALDNIGGTLGLIGKGATLFSGLSDLFNSGQTSLGQVGTVARP